MPTPPRPHDPDALPILRIVVLFLVGAGGALVVYRWANRLVIGRSDWGESVVAVGALVVLLLAIWRIARILSWRDD